MDTTTTNTTPTTTHVKENDIFVQQESREFPNLVLLERVSSYTLFGSIKGCYSAVKDSSPLLEATEGRILSATAPVVGKLLNVTAPVVEKYKTQITNIDQMGCRALDTIEETTSKQTHNLLEQPLVKRSQNAFSVGKEFVEKTVESVSANAGVVKKKALDPVGTTLELTDRVVETVLPEEEKEVTDREEDDQEEEEEKDVIVEEEEEGLSLRGLSNKANGRLKKKALSSLKYLKVRGEEEVARLRLQSVDLIAYAKEYVDTLAHSPTAEKIKTIGATTTEAVVPVVAQVGLKTIPLLKRVTSRLPFPSEEEENAEEEEEEDTTTAATKKKTITSSILYLFNLARWEKILTSLQSAPLSLLPSFLLPSSSSFPSITISTEESSEQAESANTTAADLSSSPAAEPSSSSLYSKLEWESELKNEAQSLSTLTTDVSDEEDNFEQLTGQAEVEEMDM